MELVRPAGIHLQSYVAALRSGWSADNVRGTVAAREELERIEQDAQRFLASLHPWKRGRGYAKQALKLLLPEAKKEGLEYVEITTDPDNVASQRVVLANGGVLVEKFRKPEQYGGVEGLRFRIQL